MATNASFSVGKKVWDEQHFPYGFSRSGDFTIEQASLLEKNGQAYLMLAKGEREPLDNLEKQFVDFCRGEKEPENIHEKTWKLYMERINRKVSHYSLSLAEARSVSMSESDSMEIFD